MNSNFSALLGCSIAICCFLACQQTTPTNNTEKKSMSSATPRLLTERDTIPIDTFYQWTQNWQANQRQWMQTNSINYFSMPCIDLVEALEEKPASTHFYIGLQSTGTEAVAHLILVGADANGHDLLGNGYHAFDVTKTCPPFCNDATTKIKK